MKHYSVDNLLCVSRKYNQTVYVSSLHVTQADLKLYIYISNNLDFWSSWPIVQAPGGKFLLSDLASVLLTIIYWVYYGKHLQCQTACTFASLLQVGNILCIELNLVIHLLNQALDICTFILAYHHGFSDCLGIVSLYLTWLHCLLLPLFQLFYYILFIIWGGANN